MGGYRQIPVAAIGLWARTVAPIFWSPHSAIDAACCQGPAVARSRDEIEADAEKTILWRENQSMPTKSELEMMRLREVMTEVAHRAATLGSGSDGWRRGQFMSLSNQLNAALGRSQSSHGDQYDAAGNVTKQDVHSTR